MSIKKKLTALLIMVTLLVSFAATAFAYIGNRRSYKFHHDNCRYVNSMNEENKVYIEDRDQAINSGYVPCKVCRP